MFYKEVTNGKSFWLKNSKNIFISFKKMWNKILEVTNDVSHNLVKSQYEMFGILSKKMIMTWDNHGNVHGRWTRV
jgi:hypothetical protein